MLKIEISTENNAFRDPFEDATEADQNYMRGVECRRILCKIVHEIKCGKNHGACIDFNGNKVGEWTLS